MSQIRHCSRPIPVGSAATRRLEAPDTGNFGSPTILVLGKIEGLENTNDEAYYQDIGPAALWLLAALPTATGIVYVASAIPLYRTLEKTCALETNGRNGCGRTRHPIRGQVSPEKCDWNGEEVVSHETDGRTSVPTDRPGRDQRSVIPRDRHVARISSRTWWSMWSVDEIYHL